LSVGTASYELFPVLVRFWGKFSDNYVILFDHILKIKTHLLV
jgi:hypothetical protein